MPLPNPTHLLILGCLAVLPSCLSIKDQGAPATPQRPTLSSDTSTTAAGTLELEAGISHDPGDAFSIPTTLKYGFSERSEVFVGITPFTQVELPGDDGQGIGDTLVGTRNRVWEDGPTSAAFQLATKLPTADEDESLGSGEIDFLAAGIVSHQGGEILWTGFYELGFLGEPDDTAVDLQHSLAIAASRPLSAHFSAFAEVAGIFQPENGVDSAFTTWGVAHAVAPGLVFDVAVALGLSDDAPDFRLLFGFTQNFGSLR